MVKKGDEVVTVGGMFGTVRKVADDYVILEIADRTKVRFLRRAIREIVNEEEGVDEDEEEYVDEDYDQAEYEGDEGDEGDDVDEADEGDESDEGDETDDEADYDDEEAADDEPAADDDSAESAADEAVDEPADAVRAPAPPTPPQAG
jgi:hypothetical protein